jgi:drug/metabolite transporter (DMT)-like permease
MQVPPGIRSIALGAFWFSIMSLLVKIAGRRLSSMEIVLWRGIFTLVLAYAAIRHAGLAPLGKRRGLLLWRGVVGTIALTCFYYSIVHLPLGEATLIQYMNPVFAAVLAAIFVGERIHRGEMFCIVASLAGVVLIARPAAVFGGHVRSLDPLNVAIALLGAFCSAAAYVAVRKMGTSEHRLVVTFYLPLCTVPLTLPFAFTGWVWPVGIEWPVLIGIGITTQIAQVYLTRGLQLERAARATATGYLQIVFAGLWGVLLLGEHPTLWTIGGALLIVGSTIVMTWLHERDAAHAPAPTPPAPTDAAVA